MQRERQGGYSYSGPLLNYAGSTGAFGPVRSWMWRKQRRRSGWICKDGRRPNIHCFLLFPAQARPGRAGTPPTPPKYVSCYFIVTLSGSPLLQLVQILINLLSTLWSFVAPSGKYVATYLCFNLIETKVPALESAFSPRSRRRRPIP